MHALHFLSQGDSKQFTKKKSMKTIQQRCLFLAGKKDHSISLTVHNGLSKQHSFQASLRMGWLMPSHQMNPPNNSVTPAILQVHVDKKGEGSKARCAHTPLPTTSVIHISHPFICNMLKEAQGKGRRTQGLQANSRLPLPIHLLFLEARARRGNVEPWQLTICNPTRSSTKDARGRTAATAILVLSQ